MFVSNKKGSLKLKEVLVCGNCIIVRKKNKKKMKLGAENVRVNQRSLGRAELRRIRAVQSSRRL